MKSQEMLRNIPGLWPSFDNMVACFKHVNDFSYDCSREPDKQVYSKEEIDAHLKSILPMMHVEVFESLYDYATDETLHIYYRDKSDDVLKNLASSCCIKNGKCINLIR